MKIEINFQLYLIALNIILVMSVSSEETISALIGLQIIALIGVYCFKQFIEVINNE